ncbi:hypothetical protein TW95_gp1667 [Pandoravirus inopinatum]|uniref:Uncharacterized protein n=1 Tax=Pandoravirus inopinatum TaxID=1605721 RepID=A0A0B5JBK2_9VIRU|nr:hypothetical protein TW95_gp1667 [Pandoravirus inopinatum]AJF98401.1 hypothetical protein [Pandoravirus inopinatum]
MIFVPPFFFFFLASTAITAHIASVPLFLGLLFFPFLQLIDLRRAGQAMTGPTIKEKQKKRKEPITSIPFFMSFLRPIFLHTLAAVGMPLAFQISWVLAHRKVSSPPSNLLVGVARTKKRPHWPFRHTLARKKPKGRQGSGSGKKGSILSLVGVRRLGKARPQGPFSF